MDYWRFRRRGVEIILRYAVLIIVNVRVLGRDLKTETVGRFRSGEGLETVRWTLCAHVWPLCVVTFGGLIVIIVIRLCVLFVNIIVSIIVEPVAIIRMCNVLIIIYYVLGYCI